MKKWLCFILIAVLAGAMAGAGGGGGRGFSRGFSKEIEQKLKKQKSTVFQKGSAAGSSTSASPSSKMLDVSKQILRDEKKVFQAFGFTLIIFLSMVVIALGIIFTWLSSRFRFVWFHAIVQNDASIAGPFKQYRLVGGSLFKFYLIYSVVGLAHTGVILGWPIYAAWKAGVFSKGFPWTFQLGMQFFGAPVLILLFSLLVLMVFHTFLDDFAVPIMALESCGFISAWRNFAKLYKGERGDFWRYLFVKLGLAILTGLMQMVIFIPWIIAVVISGAVCFGVPYLLFVMLLKARIVFWVFVVLLAIPFSVAYLLGVFMISLPFSVFFKNFSLYFLSSMDSKYKPLLVE